MTAEMAAAAPARCPVCRQPGPRPFQRIDGRDYWDCRHCAARFLDPSQLPSRRLEHEQYRLHDNDPDDPGYRRFQAKLAEPLRQRLRPGQSGLDYGCGPASALAVLLHADGHDTALYDPLFFPDSTVLEGGPFDFITCSEVVEHFHRPAEQFDRLDALLKPGGWLGVMTCFMTEDARFAGWHYRRDLTHVVFYREHTMRRIAADRGWHCEVPVKDVALFRKGTD